MLRNHASLGFLIVLFGALPAQGSVTPYGAGTPGLGGFVPRGWVSGSPHLGNTWFAFTLDQGLAGTAAVAVVSFGAVRVPMLSFTLLVDPAATFVGPVTILSGANGSPGTGAAALLAPLPTDSSFVGFSLYCQWFALDPAAAAGVSASDAVRATITPGPLVLGASLNSLESFVPPNGPGASLQTGIDTYGIATNRDGTLAFALYHFGPPPTGLEIFDTSAMPPTRLTTVPLGGTARALAVHPGDERLYVVYAPTPTTGAIGYHDVRKGSATFGQRLGLVTGVAVPYHLSRVVHADISADGRILVVEVFDLFAGVEGLIVVDVDPASPNRDRVLRQFHYTNTQMTAFGGVAVAADGRFAYVSGMHQNQGRVVKVNLLTGAFVNSVIFAGPADGIALDPRERFAAMSAPTNTIGQVAIVDLEPGPGYFTVRLLPTGWLGPVALNADGTVVVGPDLGTGGFTALDIASGSWLWGSTSPAATMFCVMR